MLENLKQGGCQDAVIPMDLFERGNFSFYQIWEKKDCLHFTGPKVRFHTAANVCYIGFYQFNAGDFSVAVR